MHIRSASSSAHVYGMSSLGMMWIISQISALMCLWSTKALDEMPLPSEMHRKTSDGDLYSKQEQIYDVAAAQMERGIAGKHFLEGHRVDFGPCTGASQALKNQAMDLRQIENREKAGKNRQFGKVSHTGAGQQPSAVGDDQDLAASQVLQGVVAGMMTTAASQSVQGVQLPTAVKDTVAAVGSGGGRCRNGRHDRGTNCG